jgi:cytochrome P450/NADPH-cytochrome P450 reductase
MIMVCAGTGLAPFRAFIQERFLLSSSVKLAPALLFAGCRSSTGDRLYAEEFDAWQSDGIVEVRYAFSKEKDLSDGCKYVQERITKDGARVKAFWDQGAKVYICGANMLVKEVGNALQDIFFPQAEAGQRGELYSVAKKEGRILADVFG